MFNKDEMIGKVQGFLDNCEKKIKGDNGVGEEQCVLSIPFDTYKCVVQLVGVASAYKLQMSVFDSTAEETTEEPSKSVKSELCFTGNIAYYAPTAPINSLKYARGIGINQLLFGEMECLAIIVKTKSKYHEIWEFISSNRKSIVKTNVVIGDLAKCLASAEESNSASIEQFAYKYDANNPACSTKGVQDAKAEAEKSYGEWLAAVAEMEKYWEEQTPELPKAIDENDFNERNIDDELNEDETENWLVCIWKKFVAFLKRLFGIGKRKDEKEELDNLWDEK